MKKYSLMGFLIIFTFILGCSPIANTGESDNDSSSTEGNPDNEVILEQLSTQEIYEAMFYTDLVLSTVKFVRSYVIDKDLLGKPLRVPPIQGDNYAVVTQKGLELYDIVFHGSVTHNFLDPFVYEGYSVGDVVAPDFPFDIDIEYAITKDKEEVFINGVVRPYSSAPHQIDDMELKFENFTVQILRDERSFSVKNGSMSYSPAGTTKVVEIAGDQFEQRMFDLKYLFLRFYEINSIIGDVKRNLLNHISSIQNSGNSFDWSVSEIVLTKPSRWKDLDGDILDELITYKIDDHGFSYSSEIIGLSSLSPSYSNTVRVDCRFDGVSLQQFVLENEPYPAEFFMNGDIDMTPYSPSFFEFAVLDNLKISPSEVKVLSGDITVTDDLGATYTFDAMYTPKIWALANEAE